MGYNGAWTGYEAFAGTVEQVKEKDMDAYKKYKQRQRKQDVNNATMETCDSYIEHMDLITLWVIHRRLGLGAKRLRVIYQDLYKTYMEFKRYMGDSKTKFNDGVERDDTWALKYKLKEIGFDYDEEVRLALEDNSNE